MMYVHAKAKGIRIAPRKVGLVAGLVRGRTVNDALTILQHTPKKAAPVLRKVIASAAANATHNHQADLDGLTLEHVHVGHGARMKRYFAAARGMARPYMKRTSHIHVIVSLPEPVRSAKVSSATTARVASTKSAKKENT